MRTIRVQKIADLEIVFGKQARSIWQIIKDQTQTRQRIPKTVTIVEGSEAPELFADDYECCRRIAFQIGTGRYECFHTSCGESALNYHGQGTVRGIPEGTILIDVCWNDYYRQMRLTVTSPNLSKRLEA